MDQKNEDCSESVNSFNLGTICLPPLDQDMPRNGSVVSVYAFYKNPFGGIRFS